MKSMQKSTGGTVLAIATPIAILGTLAVNTLSNTNPPGGANVGEIANTLLKDVRVLPANYAFIIWGLIYVGLIAYGIYQIRPAQAGDPAIVQVDALLIVACVAQIVWIYLFTFRQFWASTLAMGVILGSLILAYLRLGIGQDRVGRDRRWNAHIPFSIYLAWISVATIVNIASALFANNWNGGLSPDLWALLLLAIGTAIALVVFFQRRDVAFLLVFVWAYGAIAVRQAAFPLVQIGAIGGAVLLAGLVLWSLLQPRRQFE
ncbi:hypothetical protein O77CONTIG1_02802 [Leptolyngbya sp. O-77]|nr:hypothetical protein O77CONTIG1_02802 [Leptolyngbya sp. O-77]